VHFIENAFAPANTLLRDTILAGGHVPARLLVVVDRGLSDATPGFLAEIEQYCRSHADALQLVSRPLLVPGGEAVKNSLVYVENLQRAIHEFAMCRHSYIMAVGGGAVLDMAGYAAATSHRGIRIIRMPSTVLAQNDSGIGVKNGVNAFGKKNFIGTFAPPFAVLNDFSLLRTLSARDWRSGVSEAVKVALIRDAGFFEELEAAAPALVRRQLKPMQHLIFRCAELHLQHIARGGDPFESRASRPLDFGHWAAHKLEHLTRYELRHGEAVAIGMALDSTYSYLAGMLAEPEWGRILALLASLGFTLHLPELEDPGLLAGLKEFQEHLGGRLTITLLEAIGKGVDVHAMDRDVLAEAIRILRR
jgi:3-dehydroquinate synthase